ncbi:hypothetical protein LILAB_29415 [Corallococcus macrosporus]|uniref:Uncharacterized protein n=1 Tax=Myxococcus fulvus (strain ATCC BAA-855 / HW-1) TaxID=483219 RepID=F8CLQ5_MYXFH|nr:hypothetical protein LILAB_29415 [Corallococcus macrosporus]
MWGPSGSVALVQDQAPVVGWAVAEQTSTPLMTTLTVLPGSAVPVKTGASVATVLPGAGAVTSGASGTDTTMVVGPVVLGEGELVAELAGAPRSPSAVMVAWLATTPEASGATTARKRMLVLS